MFKNYAKIILRNLWRYKGYTLLNIVGMAIGIAAIVWGYQTYRYSFSYDNFHQDKDKVFRALTYKEGSLDVKGIFPMAAVTQAQNDFAGITSAARWDSRGVSVKFDKNEPFAEQAHFTDQSFFDLFNFPLVAGNNNIRDKNTVVITERVAVRYFGKTDPIGKSLTFYSGETYAIPLTVTGVLKDIPTNSSMWFDFISNFDNLLKSDGSRIAPGDWNWFLDAAFFKIPTEGDANRLAKEFNKYLPVQNKARQDWKATGFALLSMEKNAVIQDLSNNSLQERPEDSAAYGPFILAILIFLSACLNFSNTTVSRANRRLKEIGMRKVMGSSQAQLMIQLLVECALIVVLAVILSVILNQLWLPTFNSMFTGVKVEANYLQDTNLLIFCGVAILITSLLAGAYPAFYISRFNPSIIFRGTVKFGGNNLFSRVMLGLQLSIALITVIAGIGFARNAAFQKNYDYGYNIDNTIGVVASDTNVFAALRNEVAAIPQVTALAGTRNHIGYGNRSVVTELQGVKKEANLMEIGKDYLNTMNLKVVQGRAFDAMMEGDYEHSALINQTMAAHYGFKDGEVLGKQVTVDSMQYSVVGVVKDYHPGQLFDPLEPVVFTLAKENRFHFLIVRAGKTDLVNVFASTRDAWKKVAPMKPFTGFYQNGLKAESYEVTSNIATIFSWFAIISILLTATGLFALVSLTVLKKMKEIALRKVVGAGPRHILVLINRGYFWVFIIAAILGCYGGYALSSMLMNMIFRVNAGIEVTTIGLAVLVLFVIAGVTSGIKVWQAVRSNPVKNLRAE